MKNLLTSLFFLCLTAKVFTQTLTVEDFSTGYSWLTGIAQAAGDDRLFAFQKDGLIKICNPNGQQGGTFLDISAKVKNLDEYGLVGLAFHPNYATNGYFYVFYNKVVTGECVVARYSRSASNSNLANPSSELILMTWAHPESHHVGGCMKFGPDGYLYIATGDGASLTAFSTAAQNLQSYLGKILRIDVNNGATYTVPTSNPFIGNQNALPEIYAFGLRNPWRISFDKYTGGLYIGDVGQDQREEVDFQAVNTAGGQNYGWPCMEGNLQFNAANCNANTTYTPPYFEYNHAATNGCSISGGIVYRGGEYGDLFGKYIYADFCSGRIWSLNTGSTNPVAVEGTNVGDNDITMIEENSKGELFAVGFFSNKIYRVRSQNCAPTAFIPGDAVRTLPSGGNVPMSAYPVMAGYSYQWLLNGSPIAGQTGTSLNATQSGSYTLRVTNPANGCTNTSATVTVNGGGGTGGGNGIDLSLNMTATPPDPAQYTNTAVKITLTNAGPQAATGVKVKFAKPTSVVYVGGNQFTASQGTFNPNGDEVWTVGNVPANGSATLTVNYFMLQNYQTTTIRPYAQVTAANEADTDSQPNNGTPPNPVQDDEAAYTFGSTAICPAPTITNISQNGTDVTVTWTAVAQAVNAPGLGYLLEINGPGAGFPQTSATSSTSLTLTYIPVGTYTFTVKTLCSEPNFYSSASAPVNFTVQSSGQTCDISGTIGVVACHDMGTQNNASDDIFDFQFTVNGTTPGNGWLAFVPDPGGSVTSELGFFGESRTFSYPVAAVQQNMGGVINIAVQAALDATCTTTLTLSAPASCSNGTGGNCSMTASVASTQCLDNGTPNNPADDRYKVYLNVSGTNTGIGWNATTNGTNNNYSYGNNIALFGDFAISSGAWTLTLFDASSPTNPCFTTVNITPPAPCSNGGGSGQIDLSLVAQQLTASPAQWSNYPVKLTLSNTGPQAATGVKVKFTKPNGVVYVGGNEFTASQGTFNPNGDEVWTVGSIPANSSATLTVNYFLLNATAPVAYAQVTAAGQTDADSQPNNGTPPTPVQDDEAATSGGGGPTPQADLTIAELQIPTASVVAGAILSYNFDASNAGTAAVPGNFTINSYISTDQTLSANDVQEGTIQTGNYAAGFAAQNVAGASTIPASLAAGQYYLIVKIDGDNAIAEDNENNNTVVRAFTVTAGSGGGTPSCATITITPSPGKITIAGFSAPHVLIKVFKPNWTVAYECLDGQCASPTVVTGLGTGTHHVQVKLIDNSWQEICFLQQSIGVPNIIAEQDERLRLAFDRIYPNPSAYLTTMELYSPVEQAATLDFYDRTGRLVHTQKVELEQGQNLIEQLVFDWKSGTYNVVARGEKSALPAYGRFLKVWEE